MKTLFRIGTAIAAIMALAVAIVVFVLDRQENVIAAGPPWFPPLADNSQLSIEGVTLIAVDPPPTPNVLLADAGSPLPPRVHADVRQISLQVKIVEIDHVKLAELGIGLATFTQDENEATQNFGRVALLNRPAADLFINSLRANGVAKILAEPAIVSAEGRPARYRSGGEFPILVPQSAGTTVVEFREFGTSIDFTANKQPSGNLRVEMRVVQSEIDESRSVTVDGNRVPGLRTRSIDTAFEVQPGQTAMFYGKQGDGLLIMVTPELVEPAASTTQIAAAQPNPIPVEQLRTTSSNLFSPAKPAPAARPLPSPPLSAPDEQAEIAMTALVYKVDAKTLREDGIDLDEVFSTPPAGPDEKRTPTSTIEARKLASLTRRLSQSTGAEMLSRPQLLTLSGNSARVEVVKKERIPTPGSSTPVSDEYHNIGTSVDLLPVTLGEGQIRLRAQVNHSQRPDGVQAIQSTTLFGNADLYAGETLVVYEEGYDVLLFVTPRLVHSDVPTTPSPSTRQPSRGSSPPQAQLTDQVQEKQTHSFREFEVVAKELFPDATIDLRAVGNGVVLSGTVNDHEQDRVLSSIAEGLFPKVINDLRRSDSSHAAPAHIGEKLQKTLTELFPNAEIKVLPLNSSVVLNGTIESESAKQAVEIAEDYYPQVIDHTRRPNTASLPSGSNVALAAEQPTESAISINAELHELREVVRALRREVSRLIEILEDRDSTPLKAVPSDDDHSSDTSADASFKELWDVTLDEVISIGLQNSKAIRDLGSATPFGFDGKKEVVLSRVNKKVSLADFETAVRNHVSDTEEAYWALWAAQRNIDTAKKSRDAAKELWNEVYERKSAGLADLQAEAHAREQYFFFRDQLRSALKELYGREGKLRFLIGLANSDGRLMRAADEPTTDEYIIDWDDAKNSALSNTVELRQQRRTVKLAELELAATQNSLQPQLDILQAYELYKGEGSEIDFPSPVASRRAAAGVRNSHLKVTREKARLEDMERNATHLLTSAMRDVDFFYQTAKTHFNRSVAVEAEVNSITSLYKSGKTTLDLVLDAQRRLAQSKIEYTSALAQYMTAIKDAHFRRGSLLAEHNLVIDIAEEPVPASQGSDDAMMENRYR